MPDFQLWARIQQLGPQEFVVFVSTISHEESPPEGVQTSVDTASAGSLAEAQALMSRMMVEVGQRVVARGDRVVDVVDD